MLQPQCAPQTLKKRAQFLAAARGLKAARPGVLVQVKANGSERVGVGFTASKKVGNAVIRNRAKRRLREIARKTLNKSGRTGHDYVFVARKPTADCNFAELVRAVEASIGDLHRRLDKAV